MYVQEYVFETLLPLPILSVKDPALTVPLAVPLVVAVQVAAYVVEETDAKFVRVHPTTVMSPMVKSDVPSLEVNVNWIAEVVVLEPLLTVLEVIVMVGALLVCLDSASGSNSPGSVVISSRGVPSRRKSMVAPKRMALSPAMSIAALLTVFPMMVSQYSR